MPDWKETVNLPRTDFPMKGRLPETEPVVIARWEAMDLGGQLARKRAGARKFVLHDGPPYANGNIHIGHALNKILKDVVIKSRSMAGADAPYVPGWDCHGLPIELNVDRELGPKKREMTEADFRRACRRYAERFVNAQREDFKRLAILGTWDDPYLTMSYDYQAEIVLALGAFVDKGMVYKGKKPVHWCIRCQTALAEAEVEYEQHVSRSIVVEFVLDPSSAAALAERVPALAGRAASALAWTTTPWTIPSNLAVAFNPTLQYGAYSVDDRVVIVAAELAEGVAALIGRPLGSPIAEVDGRVFDRLLFRHPIYDRTSLGVLGDYVTTDQGTGVVHTAPGHGADDFQTGVAYGLDIYAPVDRSGHFTEEVGLFAGQQVFDANTAIEDVLDRHGHLWHRSTVEHSYPHCWRCHNPVIFLATAQWFIAMDPQGLRSEALKSLEQIRWIPEWGQERMRGMLANRPDWCISRQRSWGVPLPAVYCTGCQEALLTRPIIDRAAKVFAGFGADAWYERPIEEFVPADLTCPGCGGHEFERERDILDVWFDSGSSHLGVLAKRPELQWPADVYLEGSDQYRGWFHSSLLVGLGTHGRPPYRQVITHGFVVDENGRKMSKSLGNVVSPQDVIRRHGAEILRLWAAMVDYREEVRLGEEILARVVEAYRKFRNTLRYLIANLYDFDPATDMVEADRLLGVDRYALARHADAADKALGAYEAYDFQSVFHALNGLATIDLSAFYFDVSKDRLYTFGARSTARRSAQTAMYVLADSLTRLLAPILPVTTDEIWQRLPARSDASVHLAEFPGDCSAWQDAEVVDDWTRLIGVRNRVNIALEAARQQKRIGTSLEARVILTASDADTGFLDQHADDLPMLFIASQVEVRRGTGGDDEVAVDVVRAEGDKCPRCWRYVEDASTDPDVEGLCGRCRDAVAELTGGVTR